jgi:hypothetical protein
MSFTQPSIRADDALALESHEEKLTVFRIREHVTDTDCNRNHVKLNAQDAQSFQYIGNIVLNTRVETRVTHTNIKELCVCFEPIGRG